jgi:anthranilate 1,2-dioxygenase (deaminating, decarboxylating) small subunit
LPRTSHAINNVLIQSQDDQTIHVSANWQTFYYRFGEAKYFFGRANYRLLKTADGWKISYKQAIVLNDKINAVLDFYHV